jgi:hypothetical protein
MIQLTTQGADGNAAWRTYGSSVLLSSGIEESTLHQHSHPQSGSPAGEKQ